MDRFDRRGIMMFADAARTLVVALLVGPLAEMVLIAAIFLGIGLGASACATGT